MRLSYRNTIRCSYIGYITQAIVNIFAPLLYVTFNQEFEISISQITFITTLNFMVQLLIDLLSARFVDKIGYRKCIVSAHIFSAAGLVGMAVLPNVLPNSYAGLLVSVMLYAVGGGLIEVLVSPIVEACPTDSDKKSSEMSLLHSFYCWGSVAVIVITTGFFALFGRENWRIMSCLWAMVPAANAIMFSKVPIARLTEENEGMKIRELGKMKTFWIFAVLMFCAGAGELALTQWASAFAETSLNIPKTIGDLAGPCMFSVLMGLARVFYAKFSQRINLISFIIGSSVLCVVSYLIVVLSPNPILSLVGCGLCGLSVGILWPGSFSIASSECPRGGTAMFALLALAGDLGCTSGPTIVGFVADASGGGLRAGLASAIIFPVVLIIAASLFKKMKTAGKKAICRDASKS